MYSIKYILLLYVYSQQSVGHQTQMAHYEYIYLNIASIGIIKLNNNDNCQTNAHLIIVGESIAPLYT